MPRSTLMNLITAGLLTIGAAAHAQDAVVVKVADRPHAQVVADIDRAARTVCSGELDADVTPDIYAQADCVHDTVSATLSKLAGGR